MNPTHRDIAAAIETVAPLPLQESWDNSGFQLGDPDAEATGVVLCVDLTARVLAEAVERGCSMIVTHHPLLFHGVKQLLGRNRTEQLVAQAIRAGITVYSAHTTIDSTAPEGVSWAMARRLGLTGITTLVPANGAGNGFGAVGNLDAPTAFEQLVERIKTTFESPVVRCSDPAEAPCATISRVALCGGAGAEFIPAAIAAGAQIYITSDSKLNYFLDYRDRIILADIGHYESESVTKQIFYHILSGKFPNFALYISAAESNPIKYL